MFKNWLGRGIGYNNKGVQKMAPNPFIYDTYSCRLKKKSFICDKCTTLLNKSSEAITLK